MNKIYDVEIFSFMGRRPLRTRHHNFENFPDAACHLCSADFLASLSITDVTKTYPFPWRTLEVTTENLNFHNFSRQFSPEMTRKLEQKHDPESYTSHYFPATKLGV